MPVTTEPPELQELLDQMAAVHLRQATEAERDRRRDAISTALECVGWSMLGIFCIGWALHTTDITYGKMAFWGGIGIGNAGNLFALVRAYRRGERRGDW